KSLAMANRLPRPGECLWRSLEHTNKPAPTEDWWFAANSRVRSAKICGLGKKKGIRTPPFSERGSEGRCSWVCRTEFIPFCLMSERNKFRSTFLNAPYRIGE